MMYVRHRLYGVVVFGGRGFWTVLFMMVVFSACILYDFNRNYTSSFSFIFHAFFLLAERYLVWAGPRPRPIGSRHAVAPLPPSITRGDVMDGRPISPHIVMPKLNLRKYRAQSIGGQTITET